MNYSFSCFWREANLWRTRRLHWAERRDYMSWQGKLYLDHFHIHHYLPYVPSTAAAVVALLLDTHEDGGLPATITKRSSSGSCPT